MRFERSAMQIMGQGTLRRAARAALCAGILLGACAIASAQGRPPMPSPPPPVSMAPGGSMGLPGGGPGRPLAGSGGGGSSALQLGPAGRWWDNNAFAKAIGLKQEQKLRMDTVFNTNKTALFNTYRSLKTEEAKLDTLKRAESPDEDAILAQIDKVSALRGQLEKQSATLVLQLRKELSPEQVKMLESMK